MSSLLDSATGAPAGVGAGAVADGSTAGERAGRRWRRWRWTITVGVGVVLVGLLLALLVPRTPGAGRLDPEDPTPQGSRAVAQILRGQGITVTRVRHSYEALPAGAATTLVVIDSDLLGPSLVDELAGTRADLVLVEPDGIVLDALAPSIRPFGDVASAVRGPGCSAPAAEAAGPALAGGSLYRSTLGVSCYLDPGGGASYVRITSGDRPIVVIGQPKVLMNSRLAQDGNAALALWTLGHNPRLLWYVPDPAELAGEQAPRPLIDLAPAATRWVIAQLVLATLVMLAWRGRRLGRLVREPLPVVVRAAETQEGRARLYRKARARGRAAATLRTASLRRLARRLDVGRDATPEQVAALAAATSGLPPAQVHAVLLGGPPDSDAALVRLAADLDGVERAVAGGAQSGITAGRKNAP